MVRGPEYAGGVADGFVLPDFSGDLQLTERLNEMPPDARVKGMFIKGIIERAAAAGVELEHKRYVPFKDYPATEYLELLAAGAEAVHPNVPPLEGLRRLGHTVYGTFLSSTIGRVTMAVAGRDMRTAVSMVPRAYSLSGNLAQVDILSLTDRSARLALHDVWDWPGAYQVGIMEGGFDAFQVDGEVRVKLLGLCEAELQLDWHPR